MSIMPITRLVAETDKCVYRSDACYYASCKEKPVTSHTIAENYLKKLSNDLTRVLTFLELGSSLDIRHIQKYLLNVNCRDLTPFGRLWFNIKPVSK